ncbi:integrase domain-containing protein [Rudaea sp.]|uniref:integrase domain-containing protein n=1 Tax=Rudaea sp. TaxID=2136325 RepID=UPI003784F165
MAKNNFNLASRNMTKAVGFALRRSASCGAISIASMATHRRRWARFGQFLKARSIRWLEDITSQLVREFGEEVADLELSPAYAQNLISTVNTVMDLVTHGRWESVSPIACGVPNRTHVRHVPPSGFDHGCIEITIAALSKLGYGRAACVVCLARELGLRLKEAALLDARAALAQARVARTVTIDKGSKGGFGRDVPIRNHRQLEALERAAIQQGEHFSLTPAHITWAQFRDGELREARSILKACGISKYHDLRSAYACERYKELTSFDAPVFGAPTEDRDLDRRARETIAIELGHKRVDVTNCYLGGRGK